MRDLARVDEATLAGHVGASMASTLAAYAKGEDYREVVVERVLKSLGHDQTFATSLEGFAQVREALTGHAAVVARALRAKAVVARTLSVVVRFDDLTSVVARPDVATSAWTTSTRSRRSPKPGAVGGPRGLGAAARAARVGLPRAPTTTRCSSASDSRPRRRTRAGRATVALARASGGERVAARRGRRGASRASDGPRWATASELRREGLEVATQRGRHAFGPDAEDAARRRTVTSVPIGV